MSFQFHWHDTINGYMLRIPKPELQPGLPGHISLFINKFQGGQVVASAQAAGLCVWVEEHADDVYMEVRPIPEGVNLD